MASKTLLQTNDKYTIFLGTIPREKAQKRRLLPAHCSKLGLPRLLPQRQRGQAGGLHDQGRGHGPGIEGDLIQ